MEPKSRAELQVTAAALLFSTGGAAIKACTLSAWQVTAFRSGIAGAFLLALLPAARRAWTWRTLAVGFCYAATLVLFVAANKLTTSANVIFLQSTAPLYILLLGPWLLNEPTTRKDVAVIGLLLSGLLLLITSLPAPQSTAPDPARGNLLAALAGVTWALTLVGLRRIAARAGPRADSALAAAAAGNVIAFIAVMPWSPAPVEARAMDWAILVFLGVCQIGLAYVLLTSAVGNVPAFEMALLLMIEPLMNPVWAYLLNGEVPGPAALVGGALILTAAVLKNRSARRTSAHPPNQKRLGP